MSSSIRKNSVLSLILTTPLILAACSGSSTETGTENTTAEASGSLEAVCEAAAEGNGDAVWYESSLPEQATQIIAAFHKSYPEVGVVHQRVTGGAGIAGLVIQEQQAGSATADLVTGSPDIVNQLSARNYLREMKPEDLGITNQELMPAPHAVHTTTAIPVISYNTDLVSASEAPSTWDELLDDEWSGNMIMWNRFGVTLADLVPAWGEDRTREYVENLSEINPTLNESTFAIGQEVGAGTSPVGLGMYHSTFEVQQTGAPIEMNIPEPVATNYLYSGIIEESANTMNAQCFLGWLVSKDGAVAYEDATYRGNHAIEGTKTHDLVADLETTVIEFEETDKASEYILEFNEILAG